MNELLLSLGVNIASNAIYDFLKSALTQQKLTKDQLADQLSKYLNITNARIVADKIIDFAAQNGDININGTYIYANDSITMKSVSGTKFTFGNNSTSKTSTSEISAGSGASIEGQGGAQVRQNPDGSISFHV